MVDGSCGRILNNLACDAMKLKLKIYKKLSLEKLFITKKYLKKIGEKEQG